MSLNHHINIIWYHKKRQVIATLWRDLSVRDKERTLDTFIGVVYRKYTHTHTCKFQVREMIDLANSEVTTLLA